MYLLPLKGQMNLGPSSGTHQLLLGASLPSTELSPRLGMNHWAKNSWKGACVVEEPHLQGPEPSTNQRLLSTQVSCTSSHLLRNCLTMFHWEATQRLWSLTWWSNKGASVGSSLTPSICLSARPVKQRPMGIKTTEVCPHWQQAQVTGSDCKQFKFHEWQSLVN